MLLSVSSVSLMYVGFGDFIHLSSSVIFICCGTFIICVLQVGALLRNPLKYSDVSHSLSVNSTFS